MYLAKMFNSRWVWNSSPDRCTVHWFQETQESRRVFSQCSHKNTLLSTALPPACLALERVMEKDKWWGWRMMYQSGKTLEQTIDKQEVNERQMDMEVPRVLPKDSTWQERKQTARWLLQQSVTLRCTRVVGSYVTECSVYWSFWPNQKRWLLKMTFSFSWLSVWSSEI